MMMPQARGSFSEALFVAMRSGGDVPSTRLIESRGDAAISLWTLYQLHYAGLDDVDDRLEWDPALLGIRAELERDLEAELRHRFVVPEHVPDDIAEALFSVVEDHDGPSLATFVRRSATSDQTLELLRHRSIYHLKESDSTMWVMPRVGRRSQTALMELEYDEYGHGDFSRHHSGLFAEGLDHVGLRSTYGAYIDEAPVEILQQNNAMSLFGLHRRLRGAALGHLAAFEITSSLPSRMISQGLQRLGLDGPMSHYYDEHVEADAVHEQLAARSICGALVQENPHLSDDVLFGAFACLELEAHYGQVMLERWQA